MIGKIESTRTFRYVTSGNRNSRYLLYVLHGYGQLAPYFIRKFSDLNDYCIVAPEGMHRFYLQGSSGRVGASWMTKEERNDDIKDNCTWLSQLHNELTANDSYEKVIVLGFSQGGATAARWFYHTDLNADHLIMWASVFPPDLDEKSVFKVTDHQHSFVLGTEDPYFDSMAQEEVVAFYSKLQFTIYRFNGIHDIQLDTLKNVLNEIK